MLTENGRIRLKRIRWTIQGEGSSTPVDALLDEAEKSFTQGVREMLCRLNQSSASFAKTAQNIMRLASIEVSGEGVRQLVEYEGRIVSSQLTRGSINVGWSSEDCTVEDKAATSTPTSHAKSPGQSHCQQKPLRTRVYIGCDGVKVPVVAQAEKTRRRATIKLKRRRSGKKCRPLSAPRAGSDQQYQEARIVVAYNESQTHRLVIATRGDCEVTGRLLCTLATTIKLEQASESIAES